MKIIKKVQGHDVELTLIKVKEYPRYTVYDVYKDNVFLYKTCFTSLQLKELVLNKYVIREENTTEGLLCML